jgi:DNA repair protein RecO (recombination protein O)
MSTYLLFLNANNSSSSDRRFFEINLLNILGYRPSLDACSRCGRMLGVGSGNPATVAAAEILCADCAPLGRDLSLEALGLLSGALKTGRFGALLFTPAALVEVGLLLDCIIETHLDAPLRSTGFLREMTD